MARFYLEVPVTAMLAVAGQDYCRNGGTDFVKKGSVLFLVWHVWLRPEISGSGNLSASPRVDHNNFSLDCSGRRTGHFENPDREFGFKIETAP